MQLQRSAKNLVATLYVTQAYVVRNAEYIGYYWWDRLRSGYRGKWEARNCTFKIGFLPVAVAQHCKITLCWTTKLSAVR